jgi:hypothetical protein
VAEPGIETGTSGLVARNSDYKTTEAVRERYEGILKRGGAERLAVILHSYFHTN